MSKAWKELEKKVAEFFGGLRVVRIAYNEVAGDVIHPIYSIECKYGGQVPKHLSPRIPTELTVGRRRYRIIHSSRCEMDGKLLYYKTLGWVKKTRKTSHFLRDAMEQAKRYNPTLTPLVCVKSKGRHGFMLIWEVK